MDTGIPQADVARLRESLNPLRLVVAEINSDLRYVWIDNPHPDFDPAVVVGRRDDELIPTDPAAPIVAMKRRVLAERRSLSKVITFRRTDGDRRYFVAAYPTIDDDGDVAGVLTVGFETLA